MVKKEVIDGKEHFICEACGMHYLDNEWAERCEKSCVERKCCDTEVMRHRVEISGKIVGKN